MLAMQYNFRLPTDYDMSIVRQRIAAKGPRHGPWSASDCGQSGMSDSIGPGYRSMTSVIFQSRLGRRTMTQRDVQSNSRAADRPIRRPLHRLPGDEYCRRLGVPMGQAAFPPPHAA